MNNDNDTRYVGIVADGGTDRAILAHTAGVCLGSSCVIVELRRQCLRDSIDKYWQLKDTSRQAAEKHLVSAIQGVLMGALADFEARIPRATLATDVLILASDAERHFKDHRERYFEPWAWNLISTAQLGIERFVEWQVSDGRSCEYIPLTRVFIPFPSTDVLVAAVREEEERGMRALELKERLYQTTNLYQVPIDELARRALDFIRSDTLKRAFHRLPELRSVLTSFGGAWPAV
jgi:hypothetical protein